MSHQSRFYVQSNGIKLHFLQYGASGPQVLLLPGITSPPSHGASSASGSAVRRGSPSSTTAAAATPAGHHRPRPHHGRLCERCGRSGRGARPLARQRARPFHGGAHRGETRRSAARSRASLHPRRSAGERSRPAALSEPAAEISRRHRRRLARRRSPPIRNSAKGKTGCGGMAADSARRPSAVSCRVSRRGHVRRPAEDRLPGAGLCGQGDVITDADAAEVVAPQGWTQDESIIAHMMPFEDLDTFVAAVQPFIADT